jgi:hypothetical protein
MKHTVATCAHLLAAPNERSSTWSLTPAWSSMPQRGGRTSAMRSASLDGRRKVQRSIARCAGDARREQCAARGMRRGWGLEAWNACGVHEARGYGRVRHEAQGVRGARRRGMQVHPDARQRALPILELFNTAASILIFGRIQRWG